MSFDHLWNNLPDSERKRLHPYFTESHILHLRQTKLVIEQNYERTIKEIDDHIRYLQRSLTERIY